jgi:hypothetical protein
MTMTAPAMTAESRAITTLMVLRGGQVVARKAGAASAAAPCAWVESAIGP